MKSHRTRLAVEPLEDRTNPATAADLHAHVLQTYATASFLQGLMSEGNIGWMAIPSARSFVQSYFTNVYDVATQTITLLNQFPGEMPAEPVVGYASYDIGVAQAVGNWLGFSLVTTPSSPSTPSAPSIGPASPSQSVVSILPASIQTGGVATIRLTARDADGTRLTSGGSTVVFALGTGTGQGTLGSVVDNNNGTYSATFTGTTAGTNTITATLNGQAVTTTAPTITISAESTASLTQSAVSLSPLSIQTGGTSTVTLTAKDASGTQLTTGGLTVAFGLGSGTAQGTFGNVTDNANGTYSATFTGTTVGTNTVTATIGGQAVTSAAPTITVTAAAAADLAQSVVAVAPASIQSGGTNTVTLTARDTNATQLATGGLTVAFALGSGTAQGTFGSVTDNANGTYTAIFTGTTAGTNTITATVGGQPVTSTAPTVTVLGPPDLSQSLVSVAPASIQSGGTSTVTLTARDASGTQLTAGGATVVFSLGTGTGQGTFGTVTDNADGIYTATFTGSTVGTNTITATLNGQAVTSTAPTITVTQPIGTGTADPAQSLVAIDPDTIESGAIATVTLTANDINGDPLTMGGATVLFGLGAGAGQGTFGTVTDNDDGTYSADFTGTTVGANTITATFNGQALTSTAPTITVTQGMGTETADLAQSLVSVDPESIESGATTTVTLTANDSNGGPLTSGGATVVFALGTGAGQGTFGTVTDNDDGTYTADFTGTTVGTNTITATFNGQALTSAAPTVTVTEGTGTETADLAQSLVAIDPDTIESGGTATVTLTANDSNGDPLTTGGATVVFGLGAGVGQGTFGTVTDNGDGTYSADFTGTTVGTNTIIATINAQAITSTAPTITVSQATGTGTVDLALTVVSVDPTQIESGATALVTLIAKDTSGTPLTSGGATVVFSLGVGVGQGTFGPVTDNGDGTYTASFTGTTIGNNTITATIDSQSLTSTAMTVRVT